MKENKPTNLIDKKGRLNKAIAILKGNQTIKNQKEISERGLIAKTNLSRAINGDEKYLTDSFLEKFAAEFGFDRDWLIKGIETGEHAKKSYSSGRPFYDGDWELGFNESFDENLTNPEFNIDFPPANKTEGMWMRGKGKSMLGEIDPGDFIYFSPMEDFSWFPFGRIYGIVTKNKMRIVKRVVKSDTPGHYLLMSSNPDKLSYPDQEIPIEMITMMFEVKFVIKNLNE